MSNQIGTLNIKERITENPIMIKETEGETNKLRIHIVIKVELIHLYELQEGA